jgi:ABC-2 type transport system ATP-binding protein
MTELALETHKLRKRFAGKTAVADLTLSVGQGEVFGFLGPNGAGKTTSLKMLLGLIEPTSGTARVLGAPLGNIPARAQIGFLPEHFRFHEWLSGRELLRYHGRLYGMRQPQLNARIEALLGRVDMEEAGTRKVREYSKGMLQRIGLAQALLNQPRLVFLDEPTSGLDPIGRLMVRDIIRELRAEGTSVFLNSHLLGEVEATCDRVVFVKQGRAVRELLMAEAEQGLTVELKLGSISSGVLEGLARFGQDLSQADGGIRLRVADEATLPAMVRWLVEQKVDLYRMQSHRKSLEAVFMEVMGDDQRPG